MRCRSAGRRKTCKLSWGFTCFLGKAHIFISDLKVPLCEFLNLIRKTQPDPGYTMHFLKFSLTRILSRISFFFEKRITIVNHWSSNLEKPWKNHCCQWLSRYHSINGDGENFQKNIAIPSLEKTNHCHSIALKI